MPCLRLGPERLGSTFDDFLCWHGAEKLTICFLQNISSLVFTPYQPSACRALRPPNSRPSLQGSTSMSVSLH